MLDSFCRAAAAVGVLALIGCSGSDSTEPAPVPAEIVAVSGGLEPQHATVGAPVAQPPAVRVRSSTGTPMSGVAVSFVVTAGGGTVAASSTTTNGSGIAAVDRWTLGPVPGQNTLVATVSGLPSVQFQALANPGPPATLEPFGTGQSGTAGTQLPLPVGAVVRDAFGNGVSGVILAFNPVGGSVSESAVVTGSDGRAETLWTLGPQAGQHSLAVAATDAGIEHVITASASAGAPAQLILVDDGVTGTVGAYISVVPAVIVADAHGNVLPGVTVRFTPSAGSVLVAAVVSDADGHASPVAWQLGTVAGAQWIDVVAGDGLLTARISATALPGAPAVMTLLSESTVTGLVEQSITTPIRVRATDIFGNAIPGLTLTASVGGWGSISPANPVTAVDGVAELTWMLGPEEGPQQLTLRPIGASSVTAVVSAMAGIIPLQAKQVAVSWNNTRCAILLADDLVCWGTNTVGSIGDGTWDDRKVPVGVAGPARSWAHVSTGHYHTCALTTAGAAYCWGAGSLLGNGVSESRNEPTAVAGGHSFESLSAGQYVTCGLKADGELWCWGSQGGHRRLEPYRAAQDWDARFLSVSVGGYLATGLVSIPYAMGAVQYWWTTSPLSGAAPVWWGNSPMESISGGEFFDCGLGSDGTAYCHKTATWDILPIASDLSFTAISAGRRHACAVANDGDAYCWGENEAGQLGIGTTISHTLPQRVQSPAGVRFHAISAGDISTCAIAMNSDVYCWGVRIGGVYVTPRRERAQ